VIAGVELLCKHLVQFPGIKADHYLLANDNGGSGTAVVRPHQFKDSALVRTHVFQFEWNPFLRKVGFSPFAWRSTRLAIDNNLLLRHSAISPFTK